VAAGAALGASAALLITEQTGPERRAGIARGARRFGHRAERAWDDLGFELREAARAARNRLRRRHHPSHDDIDEDED
jgi:gas vesicle protein